MKFSERMGIVQVNEVIQTDSMNKGLRVHLWNAFYIYFGMFMDGTKTPNAQSEYLFKSLFNFLWTTYFGERLDNFPSSLRSMYPYVRNYFFSCDWYEVYDFQEAIMANAPGYLKTAYELSINKALAHGLSGYRCLNGTFSPITSKNELEEIQSILEISESQNLEAVKTHIQKALELLSTKPVGDYRNSIKESISAVESACKILSGEQNAELAKSLGILSSKIYIHKALISGFKSIYGFTSDEGGIRHSLLEESSLGQEDAIYMLVSCSAFINYLIAKNNKIENQKFSL